MAIILNGSTGISSAGNVVSAGNVTAENVLADNYYYGNGTPFSGGASTGNIGFSNVTMYSLPGLAVNNSDLSHGSTAGLNIPANGSGTAELFNTYGDVNIIAGTGPSHTYNFGADGIAELGQIVATGNIVGGNLNTGGVVSATGNVRGSNLNTAGIVSAAGNVTGGNIVTSGNVSGNFFIGNGSQLTGITSSANTGNLGFDQYNIYNTTGGGVIVSNLNYLSAEAETAYVNIPAGNSPGDLQIVQEQGNVTLTANSKLWSFNSDESIRFPNNANIRTVDNTITQINSVATANGAIAFNVYDSVGNNAVNMFMDGTDKTAFINTYNPDGNVYSWSFDNGGSFTLPNAPGNVYFGSDANGPVVIPSAFGVTLNANRADSTVNYVTVGQDGIDIVSIHNINIDNSTAGLLNTDININSGDDIFLRGRNKPADTESEGGDINITAGQGSDASSPSFDPSGGGDISIRGGLGGSGTGAGANGQSGGFIDIVAGDGGTSIDSITGSGGSVFITAGSSQTPSDPAAGGWGGSVEITAGATTRVNENGGSVTIASGGSTGLGYGAAGYVGINIPASNVGPGGSWTFSGTGTTLNVPANSEIFGANFGNFTVGCAGNTFITSSDYGANVKNWLFSYNGNLIVPGPITRNDYQAPDLLVATKDDTNWAYGFTTNGIDTFYTQAKFFGQGAATRGFKILDADSGDAWVFDGTGSLSVPNNTEITTPDATDGLGGASIDITAGSADQTGFYTTPGGNVNITGGLGAFNDGGGGGPGGNVNLVAGLSADPAGHAGNINITAGPNNWVFDYTGNLTAPGNITLSIVKTTPVTFSALPSAADAGAGARAFITDANTTVFGAQVGGGGITYMPVFSNGTNWYVG